MIDAVDRAQVDLHANEGEAAREMPAIDPAVFEDGTIHEAACWAHAGTADYWPSPGFALPP